MLERILELDFFLNGYKPAICVDIDEDFSELSSYPRVSNHSESYIYFQNEDKKNEYLQKLTKIKDEPSFDRRTLLGETFGYPPEAVLEFNNRHERKPNEQPKRYLVNFYGLCFVSFKNTLKSDLVWLKNNYLLPKQYNGFIVIEEWEENGKIIYFKYHEDFCIDSFLDSQTIK